MKARNRSVSSSEKKSPTELYGGPNPGLAPWPKHENELEMRAWFVERLVHQAGWTSVHQEVYCRLTGVEAALHGQNRCDVYALPPQYWRGRKFGIQAVVFELKHEGCGTGGEVIDAVHQCFRYRRAIDWRIRWGEKGGLLRPPDVVVLVTPRFLNHAALDIPALELTERFLWKWGCSLLVPPGGNFGFSTNIGTPGGGDIFLPIFHP